MAGMIMNQHADERHMRSVMLIFSLYSCNTLDRQVLYRYCHDTIHAWKNPDLKTFAVPFPVLGIHTQKEYLHSIFRLMSDLLLQI